MDKILVVLVFLGVVGLVGIGLFWFFAKRIILRRLETEESINSDLDVIRFSRPFAVQKELKKEDIEKMEHLLAFLEDLPGGGKGFLYNLFYGRPHLALELAVPSNSNKIFFYIAMPKNFRKHIEEKIEIFFPSSEVERVKDYTIFNPNSHTTASYLKLKKDDSFPVKTYRSFDFDVLDKLVEAFSSLDDASEGAAIQVIFRKSHERWSSKSKDLAEKMKLKMKGKGDPETERIFGELVRKSHKPLVSCNIRLLASAKEKERSSQILGGLESIFTVFENPGLNKFVAIRDRSSQSHKLSRDFIFRAFEKEQRVILDTEELATIFHFPLLSTNSDRISWYREKSVEPEKGIIGQQGVRLGRSIIKGQEVEIHISPEGRSKHLYLIGQDGTGKSTLLKNIAISDVLNGDGICFMAPDSDACDYLAASVPAERKKDVIYIDFSKEDQDFAFSLLEHEEGNVEEIDFLVNEGVEIFNKAFKFRSNVGPTYRQYMASILRLFIGSKGNKSSILEIPRFFSDAVFRQELFNSCVFQDVVDYWKFEIERIGGDDNFKFSAPYMVEKISELSANDKIRRTINQGRNSFKFRDLMDQKKIVLINLAKDRLGKEGSDLMGLVINARVLLANMRRNHEDKQDCCRFYYFLDEFQNYSNESIGNFVAGENKNLCLNMSHSSLSQLPEQTAKSIFENVGSMLVFRVDNEDSKFLAKYFEPTFKASDVANTANYNCLAKISNGKKTSKPFNMSTYPAPKMGDVDTEELKRQSYEAYGIKEA